jgi:CRISPR-associated protein Cmr2
MSYDYWATMRQQEWPDLDAKISEFTGKQSGREAWIKQNLKPLLIESAADLAYYRAFERAALAFCYYDALEDDDAREDVKAAYSAPLVPEYFIPEAVTHLKTALALEPIDLALDHFPRFSTVWQFQFKLATDYLSQDDVSLYPIDNPVRKEHVLKLPMVAPTGWKGALRSAFRLQHGVDDESDDLVRLFGQTRDNEEGQAGRLYFFPTYFARLGLIVINPHDRETGIGARGPISFETVPRDSDGYFTLLYVPRGNVTISEIGEDISKTTQALRVMFRTYGFGAKTSSGFGVAREECKGILQLKTTDPVPVPVQQEPEPPPDLPRYLSAPNQLHPDFRADDGGLNPEAEYRALIESRGQKYGKKNKLLYKKAKNWWEREGKTLAEKKQEEPERKPEAREKLKPTITTREFKTFDELVNVTVQLTFALAEAEGEEV